MFREPVDINSDNLNDMLLQCGLEDEEQPAPVVNGNHRSNGSSFDVRAFLASHGITIRSESSDSHGVKMVLEQCPFDENHKAPDSAVWIGHDGKPGFKCFHSSCAGHNWKALRQHLDPGCYDRQVSSNATAEHQLSEEYPRLIPVNYRQFASDHPKLSEVVIDNLARRGETVNVVAASKVGKSWLVYGLLLCVILGWDWLGRFRCRGGRVLLIDNELQPSNLANRIRTVAEAMDFRPEDYESGLDILSLRGRLVDLNRLIIHLEAIKLGAYDLIIFDAWYRGLPAGVSENDNAQVAMLYNAIDAATARLGCAWVNIHHASKGDQGGKSVTDVGAGAGSQSRAADSHVILRPHEEPGIVVLEAAVRSFAPVEPLALRWNFPLWQPVDGIDTGKLKGTGTKQQEQSTALDREGKHSILAGIPQGFNTARKLRAFTKMSRERVVKLLDQLELADEITSTKEKIGGKTIDVYSLFDTTSYGVGDE